MSQINKDCQRCPLFREATNVCIGGRGPEPASLLIVGQNPGYKEDRLGEPFVGESGTLLNRLLREIDPTITVRITNAVKCYTPENRKPNLTEQEACRPYLIDEILACRPLAILALGNEALVSLTGKSGVNKQRGVPQDLRATIRSNKFMPLEAPKVLAAWHPAFVIRDPSHRRELEEDLAGAVRYIRQLRGEELGQDVSWKELECRQELLDYASRETSSTLSYDIETNSADIDGEIPVKVHMIGISDGETALVARSDLDYVAGALAGLGMVDRLVGYNSISFDDEILNSRGVPDITSQDVIYLDYLLDEGVSSYDGRMKGRHKLQSSVTRHLQIPPWKDEVTWKWEEFDAFDSHGPWEKAALYNARDCIYTAKLYKVLEPRLTDQQRNLVKYLMHPAGRFLARIERRGIPISLENLARVRLEVEAEVERALDQVVRAAFNYNLWTFNPNSHPQVRDLLYNKLKLVPTSYTPGGEPSTDQETLQALLLTDLSPENAKTLQALIDLRGANKLKSTYLDKCLPGADGRINTSYSLISTVTGRTSSFGWSTQRTPRDKRIRSLVCAPTGYKLVSYDLSQIEMRTMTWLSKEPNMMRVYKEGLYGGDLHSYMAERLALALRGSPEFTKEDRDLAKPANFSLLYGADWFTLQAHLLKEYGIKLTTEQAIFLRDEVFFKNLAGLPDYYNKVIRGVLKTGKVVSCLGNVRQLPNIKSKDPVLRTEAAREALNTENQGLASHIALIGCVLVETDSTLKWIEQVAFNHDAGLALVKDEYAEQATEPIKQKFEVEVPKYLAKYFGINFDVPIKLDVKISQHWS